ncbi:MAG: aminoacyl-tRNA hydrolase [Phycisphaerales bacterium]
MKVLVGLGNPGREYERTRHNAGFMVIDRLLQRHAPGAAARARFNAAVVEAPVGGQPTLLVKPTTYMNRSGQSVAEVVNFYKLSLTTDVLVLVDEVYLPCGTLRLRPGGGSAGHNGLTDIQRALGSDDYPRLRIGVGPKPEFFEQSDYVLGRFTDEEWARVAPVIDKAADAAEVFLSGGLNAAMNRFNAPDTPPRPKPPRPETPQSDTQT